ncbi:MAG: hypothetical protein PHR61_00775 [Candidatus Absconditabacteria bacterium]|nr:hypothetical protein [Candidatus Absconditabacteria bacterium]
MQFNSVQQLKTIELTEKESIHIQRLASSRRRAAVNYLNNMDDIYRDTIEALNMAYQARSNNEKKGFFQPILSCGSEKINDENFYKLLNSFTKADVFFVLNQRIFRKTLLENKGEFDYVQQMEEIKNNETEMHIAARIMDNKTIELFRKNKKKEA